MTATPEQLLARARTQTGLLDMGMDGWQEGLEQLVRAVTDDVGNDAEAVSKIEGLIHRRIVTRLQIEAWYATHEAEAAHPVEGPLVIVGLPRTATTATHYLLANDPQIRYLRRWERDQPVPPPDIATEAQDPRRPREPARAGVMHIATVDGPVEDGHLHGLHFHGEPALPLPTYAAWWRSADHTSSFAYHERVLRLLHSRRPPHYWLMKYPGYAYQLHDIIKRYPNAKFVMTHRDPVALIPSTCSVTIEATRKRVPGWTPADPVAFGREVLDQQAEAVRRAAAARAVIGEARFLDIAQPEMERDPVAVAERIYAFAGLRLDETVRQIMVSWAAGNRRGSRGEHRYTPEEFGLTAATINHAFADYIRAFGKFCYA
jgi:hypothetical protein